MASLRTNFLWNASFQLIRILTPLITTPYLARVLGSEGLGAYSYTYAIANYACLFVLLGINQYGNREIAKVRNEPARLAKTFSSIFTMQISWGLMIALLYLAVALFFFPEYSSLLLIWAFWVVGEVFDTSWFFFGLEEFRVMTIRNLIVRIAVIVAIFLFVRTPSDAWVYCLLQSLAFLVSSAVLLPMLFGKVGWVHPHASDVLAHIKPNLILFAPVIAITLYVQANKLILGGISGMSEVAFYDNADKISVIPLAVIQSLGTVMLPRMSQLRSMGQTRLARNHFDVTVWFGSIMAFGFSFGIVAVSNEFVPVFFGPGYEKCAILMPLLALIIPSVAWSNALGVQWLLPAERDKQYLFSVVIGAAINLLICAVLVPGFASIGAAVATIIAELAVVVSQALMLRNELPILQYLRDAVPFAVFGLVMLALVRLLANVMTAGMLTLLLEVLFGAVAYCTMCFFWLFIKHDERLEIIMPMLKKRGK